MSRVETQRPVHTHPRAHTNTQTQTYFLGLIILVLLSLELICAYYCVCNFVWYGHMILCFLCKCIFYVFKVDTEKIETITFNVESFRESHNLIAV